MQRTDKIENIGEASQDRRTLEELFALLDTSETIPLEDFFDRVPAQRKQKR
ncbi:MAG: hypothetical protein NWQ23_03490 [Yoonia sp.]|uniref:hypothetical protein n=1 Tax=Yoonia sp. TaxID=2212373 RepID=UPI00273FA643|nr:hypothetical protein [Yoonia sp.]MDP5084459.1 hypothetical protein [Yoonia sp.]